MSDYYKDTHRYDDIMDLPHHQSDKRASMSLHDRAAQFAPFAALSGHEEAIEETARFTDEQLVLDESMIDRINETLSYLAEHLAERTKVSITYFVPDPVKRGGAYLTDVGTAKKIDKTEQLLFLENGVTIPMQHIISIEVNQDGVD